MSVAAVSHYENVDLQLEVENLDHIQSITDVSSVLMEINDCLMLMRVLLFDKPPAELETVFRCHCNIIVLHVALAWVTVGLRVVLGVSEAAVGRIRYVQHAVLHEVGHDERQEHEEAQEGADLHQELEDRHDQHFYGDYCKMKIVYNYKLI